MKRPYAITPNILRLVASISEKIGVVNAVHLNKPPIALRKKNRIKTIQASLEIEGNTLGIEQVTALLNNKRIIAPQKDILEVENAALVYNQLKSLSSISVKDFNKAHRLLMNGLIKGSGKFRITEVGIAKGSQVTHLAPSGHMVKSLVNNLFAYLKSDEELRLIKSCVFHYELEFIHPFLDGNGRMGRLWQTLILMEQYPVFEFLPIESIIKERQRDYYKALSDSDKSGSATTFIFFMLSVIESALDRLLDTQNVSLSVSDRISIFKEIIKDASFTRQDYLKYFKQISTATASRDLKFAVSNVILVKEGDKRLAKYRFST